MVPFKKLLSRSKTLNALLGDTIFVAPQEHGALPHSFFEWRVKESLNKDKAYIGVAMRPDGYAGAEGSPTNYINFDVETAIRLRDHLSSCIDVAQRRQDHAAGAAHG